MAPRAVPNYRHLFQVSEHLQSLDERRVHGKFALNFKEMLDLCCTNHPGIPIQQLVAFVIYTWDRMPVFVPEVKEQLTAQEPTPSTQASSTQAVAKGNGKGNGYDKEKNRESERKREREKGHGKGNGQEKKRDRVREKERTC